MGNLAGWPYWKVISITGQSGAGTDYQVKLTIGDSAGGDFHLEGHCTNFPQDIRITDDDGTTLLDHWVEDLTADPIVVHVEVKDDLGSNQDIRVYYGKSGETTASNITNTMLDGDDFPGSSLNSAIWDSQYCDVSVSGGILTLDNFVNTGGRYAPGILSKILLGPSVITEIRIKNVYSGDRGQFGLSNNAIMSTDDFNGILQANTELEWGWQYNEGTQSNTGSVAFTSNTYYRYKILHDGVDVHYYRNGVEKTNSPLTTNVPDEQMYMLISGDADHPPTYMIDWIFVRKYNSPEPAFSSAGSEETPPAIGHPWFYERKQ